MMIVVLERPTRYYQNAWVIWVAVIVRCVSHGTAFFIKSNTSTKNDDSLTPLTLKTMEEVLNRL